MVVVAAKKKLLDNAPPTPTHPHFKSSPTEGECVMSMCQLHYHCNGSPLGYGKGPVITLDSPTRLSSTPSYWTGLLLWLHIGEEVVI